MSTKTNASLMTDTWTELLHETDDPCVQTTKGSGPIYTHNAYVPPLLSLPRIVPDSPHPVLPSTASSASEPPS